MSCKLNEYNEKTKKVIHLMVTSLCDRNCPDCCNKQYSLDDIPYITDAELKECKVLCITGGEPFRYAHPNNIAFHYHRFYPNIEKVYVYTNAFELNIFLGEQADYNCLVFIDGLNVSIKTMKDLDAFNTLVNNTNVKKLTENRLYVFNNIEPSYTGNFTVIKREWQKEFVPADDSIFRKV